MKHKNFTFHRVCILVILLLMCMLLSACRDSPVLEEVVYTHSAPVVDVDQEMLDPEDEGEQDEEFSNEKDDVDTDRDSQEDEGLANENGNASEATDSEYNSNSGNHWNSGDAPSQPAEGTGTDPSGENEQPENVPGDIVSSKQIVDGSGRTVTVPENVDTVTAVGAAAQMVEMVGGTGRLAGADQAFLSSGLAKAAFSDLSSIKSWWDGNGDSGISSSNFSALLTAKPDVCFEISGKNTFSNAQVAQLESNGIAYVVLPAPTSQDTLKQAVTIVADVMGHNATTGESASSIASAYASWADNAVKEVGNKTAGKELTSLYVSGWDASAQYQLNNTKGVIDSSGSGLATAYSPTKTQLVSTYMSAANVVNESTRIRSIHRDAEEVYVAPMFHQFDAVVSGSRAAYYSGAGEYGAAYDLFAARMITDSLYYQLGSSQFPAVIAADADVKKSLENNWFWQYHPINSTGYVTVSGQSFYCGVVGQYKIYTNPQGMCDWAEGSVESPLEAYWVASKLSGVYSMTEVYQKTNDFYKSFFGVELSSTQLSQIFVE